MPLFITLTAAGLRKWVETLGAALQPFGAILESNEIDGDLLAELGAEEDEDAEADRQPGGPEPPELPVLRPDDPCLNTPCSAPY